MEKIAEDKEGSIEKKFWWLGIQVALIFGVPAFSALFGGRALDAYFGTGKTITLIALACAFVLSWVVLFKRVNSLTREMKQYNKENPPSSSNTEK